jgi:DNA-binding MarR family transcriptional regulator
MSGEPTTHAERLVYALGTEIESEWSADERAAWSGFVDLATRIARVHTDEFQQRHGLSLSAIGLLGRLAADDHDGVRLSDLATDMGLSLGRVSRIVDGLEQRGLVERAPSRTDARAINARLTPLGATTTATAQRTVRDAVGRDFLAGLDDAELQLVARTLGRLVDNIRAVGESPL